MYALGGLWASEGEKAARRKKKKTLMSIANEKSEMRIKNDWNDL